MRISRIPFACLISLLFAAGIAAAAPPPGPLTGRELSVARAMQSGLESVAGSLLLGELRGEVTKVVVTEDSPRRLVVAVSYDGFTGGRLWGEVLESKRSRHAGVSTPEAVTVAGESGEIELVFEATDPAAASRQPRSPYLRINVALANRKTASYKRTFDLGKVWGSPVPEGASFLATITPQPIGKTAELGPQPSMVVPDGAVVSPPPSARVTPPQPAPMSAPAPTGGATRKTMMAPVRGVAGTGAATGGGTRAISPTTPTTAPAPTTPRKTAVAGALSKQATMVEWNPKNFGLTPTEVDGGARGPAAAAILPFGEVRTENIQLDLPRVLNFAPEIYQDQNPASGIFYFVPHRYGLKWDATDGYQLRTVYAAAAGAADAAGAAGQVLMAARLDAGIGTPEVQLATAIVQRYANARRLAFTELRALPIDTVSVSLASALGQFSIPADKVAVHGLSGVMGQMDVSWVTDERTTAFVQEALVENVGVNGDVTFSATGSGAAHGVPVRILLADFGTFGPFRWDRTGWKNVTPYPITLKYLHALRVTADHPPVVHSWSLGETKVPPGGQVRWNATTVPFWLDGQAQKMWLDYSVDGSCSECGAQAIVDRTGGVSGTAASEITFHTLSPLADANALEIVAEVRSRYFDPHAREVRVKRVVLDADGKDFRLGPLFAADRVSAERRSNDPLFEFRLQLTMKDGRPEGGAAKWIPSHDLRVPIGRFQLETSIGALPPR